MVSGLIMETRLEEHLLLCSATGRKIEVPVDEGCENWQIDLPDGRQSIGMPGGGI